MWLMVAVSPVNGARESLGREVLVSPEPGAPSFPASPTPSVSRELKNAEDPCAEEYTRIVQVHTHSLCDRTAKGETEGGRH